MNIMKSLTTGLEQAIAIEKGKLPARTKTLTISPLEKFSKVEIKAIRNNMEMSQTIFAKLVGVSVKTVEAWESGKNNPSGPASRVIALLKQDPTLPEKCNIVIR